MDSFVISTTSQALEWIVLVKFCTSLDSFGMLPLLTTIDCFGKLLYLFLKPLPQTSGSTANSTSTSASTRHCLSHKLTAPATNLHLCLALSSCLLCPCLRHSSLPLPLQPRDSLGMSSSRLEKRPAHQTLPILSIPVMLQHYLSWPPFTALASYLSLPQPSASNLKLYLQLHLFLCLKPPLPKPQAACSALPQTSISASAVALP